jgi:hypothetical protein
MAMDKDRLGAAYWSRVKALHGAYSPSLTGAQDAAGLALWTAIADETIKEIVAHADILVNVFAAAATSVQPGVGTSGNITGTATGKVSA